MDTARTLTELYFGALDRFGSRPVAMRAKQGGGWIELSYRDLADRVQDLSIGLLELGLRPGDRVAILSENRPEWAIADYACLAARCADVPIYPTLPASRSSTSCATPARWRSSCPPRHSSTRCWRPESGCRRLRHIIAFDADATGPGVLPLDELYAGAGGAAGATRAGARTRCRVRPDDLATLIYTSGTTGDLKGVMLTHGNIASNVTTCCTLFSFAEDDECLSFLPLSHIFERMFGHYCMFHAGVVINYAESIDTVAADMQQLAADPDGLGAAAVREDLRPGADAVRAGSAREAAHLLLGASAWARRRWTCAWPATAAPGARAAALAGRPAGLRQAARPHRRPAPLLHLGRRAALGRHREVLPRRRACRSSRDTGSPRPLRSSR